MAPASPSVSTVVSPVTAAATGDCQARMDSQKKSNKCYKYEKDKCNNEKCKFFHPKEVCEEFSRNGVCRERSCLRLHKGEHRGDCYYWKQGGCRYSEEECGKGRHRLEMFDYNNLRKQQQHHVSSPGVGSATPTAAPFFGAGHGGAVPPPNVSAMSNDQMMAMVQFLSGQLVARNAGN